MAMLFHAGVTLAQTSGCEKELLIAQRCLLVTFMVFLPRLFNTSFFGRKMHWCKSLRVSFSFVHTSMSCIPRQENHDQIKCNVICVPRLFCLPLPSESVYALPTHEGLCPPPTWGLWRHLRDPTYQTPC